jgi:succinyl-CoA synthetase beta subunit
VAAARDLVTETKGGTVVIKIQGLDNRTRRHWGVAFAKKTADVRGHAARMLEMKVGQFPVETVLVEEKIDIAKRRVWGIAQS